MGSYHKIANLYSERAHYKEGSILDLFKELYYLEKIDGSSAFVKFTRAKVNQPFTATYYGGGQKQATFEALFNREEMLSRCEEKFAATPILRVEIYGEVYGGKIQAMSKIYGIPMGFIVFEVRIGDTWLNVPNAESVAWSFGLEFVHYVRGPATLEFANAQRDAPSMQAERRGMGEDKFSEGVIIRPLIELTRSNGERIIVKHKAETKRETKTPRVVSTEDLEVLSNAQQVADEWVVEERLDHVINRLRGDGVLSEHLDITKVPEVIRAMIEDVKVEGASEIAWSKHVERAIGARAVLLYKGRIKASI